MVKEITMKIILCVLLVIIFLIIREKNSNSATTTAATFSSNPSARSADPDSSSSGVSWYNSCSDFEKSDLYFNHRLNMVLKKKYPDLLSWRTALKGVSLLNQAIEVVVSLPDEKEERIWITANELMGSFPLWEDEIPSEDISDESVPLDMREFFEKNTSIIEKKISHAVEKKLSFAYFEFRDNETEEFMQKVTKQLAEKLDGVMVQLNDRTIELNVQNLIIN